MLRTLVAAEQAAAAEADGDFAAGLDAALARAQEVYGKMSPEDRSMNLHRRKPDAVGDASAATV